MCLFPPLAFSRLVCLILGYSCIFQEIALFFSHHIVTINYNNQKFLYSTLTCVWNIEIKRLSIIFIL